MDCWIAGAKAKLGSRARLRPLSFPTVGLLLMVGVGGGGLGQHQGVRAEAIKIASPTAEMSAAVTTPEISSPAVAVDPSGGQHLAMAQAGYDFLEKGWVDDAIQAFQAALRQEPDGVDSKLGLAIAYQRAGRDQQAWQTYGAVLEQDGNNEPALRAVGSLGGYRSDWQTQGIEALDRLLELYPDEVELRAQRAILLGYQQRFEGAIADYELLLTLGDDGMAPMATLPVEQQSMLLVNAAQIYTYSEQTDLALPLFERYLSEDGMLNHPASLAYATTLRKQNRASQAIELLEGLTPAEGTETFEQRLALALAHQANADPLVALATLQPVLDPLPEDLQQRRAIANTLVPIDLPPVELLPALESLLQDPDPVTFLQFRVAQIQLAQGELESAQASLLAYQASTDALDVGTEFLLADLDQRSGNLEASAQRYGNLMDLTEGAMRWDALGGVAAIRFEQQHLSEAEGLYRQLLSQRPEDVQARRTFAELMLAQDKPKAAMAQFAQAQLLMPRTEATVGASTDEQSLEQRQRTVRRSFLRRRGFQPRWEHY